MTQMNLVRRYGRSDFDILDSLVNSVKDSAGVYFVPAFSGLFAPYWRDDASGYA